MNTKLLVVAASALVTSALIACSGASTEVPNKGSSSQGEAATSGSKKKALTGNASDGGARDVSGNDGGTGSVDVPEAWELPRKCAARAAQIDCFACCDPTGSLAQSPEACEDDPQCMAADSCVNAAQCWNKPAGDEDGGLIPTQPDFGNDGGF